MTGEQLTELMMHAAWLGVLLLTGKFLSAEILLLRKLFLPSSIIAGVTGALLGPQVLGRFATPLISQEMSDAWSLYPGRLINVVFACLFLGVTLPSFKKIWKAGGPQLCYGWTVGMGQYIIGVGLCVVLLTPLFGVPHYFGCLLEIGFSGGHGTAAGMQETFRALGFESGADLGLMSATVGILCSVIFGMILINLAIRRGCTRVIKKGDSVSLGIDVPAQESQRAARSMGAVSPDALAIHVSFAFAAILLGRFILDGIQCLSARTEPDLFKSFPLFPAAMLGGVFIQAVADKTGASRYLDRHIFNRIMDVSLDFLVVSAVASIRLDVFFDYFQPFLILMAVGLAWMLFSAWFLAPRMLPDAWFERGIVEFGMQTGVTAMGLVLLRAVDPRYETPAAESFGFKQILYEPMLGGGFITASAPIIIARYGTGTMMAIAAGSIFVALIPILFFGRSRRTPK